MIEFDCKGPQINKAGANSPAMTASWTGRCMAASSSSTSPGASSGVLRADSVADSIRQESLTADTQGDGASCVKSVFLGESCPCLRQQTAGAWEDSAAWPDVKVPHTYPLSQCTPSRQSQITKPNQALGLLLGENS